MIPINAILPLASMRAPDTVTPQDSVFDEAPAWVTHPNADGEGTLWWRLALALALTVVALAATVSLLA